VEIHQRLYREWPELSRRYREALPEITSPERWSKTFAASAADQRDR
jgi:galactofuranosylgalactofuranosylrhamnosyl-N-acetylglucosaminyl-diphospho-decaprenol beta-1,5/1,6-galactofuranosyltransferase